MPTTWLSLYIYIYSGEKIKTTFLKLISEKG